MLLSRANRSFASVVLTLIMLYRRNCYHAPKDNAEGKYLEENAGADRQMFLFACHCERGEREGPIVEGELEGHMDGVKQHFLAY